MGWSYSPENLIANPPNQQTPKDQVRFLTGDVNSRDSQVQDEEIFFSLQARGDVWGATAMVLMAIAANKSRLADSQEGPLRTLYSSQAKAYAARAAYYDSRAVAVAGGGYSGGISITDVVQRQEDPDRTEPQFRVGQDDNFYPVAPAEPGAAGEDDGNVASEGNV